jgi:hypothetical protein
VEPQRKATEEESGRVQSGRVGEENSTEGHIEIRRGFWVCGFLPQILFKNMGFNLYISIKLWVLIIEQKHGQT